MVFLVYNISSSSMALSGIAAGRRPQNDQYSVRTRPIIGDPKPGITVTANRIRSEAPMCVCVRGCCHLIDRPAATACLVRLFSLLSRPQPHRYNPRPMPHSALVPPLPSPPPRSSALPIYSSCCPFRCHWTARNWRSRVRFSTRTSSQTSR